MNIQLDEDLKIKLKKAINSSKIMLFMKGEPERPMCRFSAHIVSILEKTGVEFGYFNIFEDEEVRQGLKEYSEWPTFPQLYINGELIGGDDIVTEMSESGELEELLKN